MSLPDVAAPPAARPPKVPESVFVVILTADLQLPQQTPGARP
ncbi:hypothetical protein ACWA7J_17775 [Leptothrix sp. BB-4]